MRNTDSLLNASRAFLPMVTFKSELPMMPNEMTMAEEGRDVINWGSRAADVVVLTQSMTSARTKEILGRITPEDANNIMNFIYIQQII